MRKISALLIGILLLSIITMPAHDIKAASVVNEYSVKVGKKLTLKTSLKKAVWGSDDLSVATVSSKGVVKGVSEGACTIVATSKGKSELFSIKVTKSKSNSKLIEEIGVENYLTFVDKPVAYIDGNKIVFFETTFSEFAEVLKSSKYTISCDHETSDVAASTFMAQIMKGKNIYARIEFEPTDNMLAKDAYVSSVELAYQAPSNFYYFNKNFKLSNIPDFAEFKKSNTLIDSSELSIKDSKLKDGTMAIQCKADDIRYVFQDEIYGHFYSLLIYFDASTHKCIYFYLAHDY